LENDVSFIFGASVAPCAHHMALGTQFHTHELRRFAVATDADERTVARLIRGERVLPAVAARIRAGLERFGVYLPGPVRRVAPITPANNGNAR
jgi:hypothetical protein